MQTCRRRHDRCAHDQQGQGSTENVAANPDFAVLPAEQFDGTGSGSAPSAETSLLLIRAMIAAAMADGHLDPGEQARIFGQAGELGLSDSDKVVLFDELRHPRSVEAIAADARDPVIAVEVYAASLLAVDETTAAAKTYLNELALRLNLPSQLVEAVHQQASDNTAARSAA